MPFGNVFEKINSEYYQLTSAEKKVADYAAVSYTHLTLPTILLV